MDTFSSLVLDSPAEVRDAEPDRVSRSGKLSVIYEGDAPLLQEPTGVDEVKEHSLEPMVPIDEGKIELSALSEETGEHNLRLLAEELNEITNTGLCQYLKPDASVRRRVNWQSADLIRIGGDVTPVRPVREHPFADEQRRDREAKSGFQRPVSALGSDPVKEGKSLLAADRDGKQITSATIRLSDDGRGIY